jgi:structural maintenance of chromosome 4
LETPKAIEINLKSPSQDASQRQQRSTPRKPVGPVKRTIITQMVVHNFKSYAGTMVIGPFHKCFSAVVGPNGSGKSNVIDALLFVFGKRAKQLRQKNLSQLIHKSALHPDCRSTRVDIHFQDILDVRQ